VKKLIIAVLLLLFFASVGYAQKNQSARDAEYHNNRLEQDRRRMHNEQAKDRERYMKSLGSSSSSSSSSNSILSSVGNPALFDMKMGYCTNEEFRSFIMDFIEVGKDTGIPLKFINDHLARSYYFREKMRKNPECFDILLPHITPKIDSYEEKYKLRSKLTAD